MQSATTSARSGRLCRSILSRVRGRRAALVAFVTIATTSSSRATTTTNAQRSNDDGDMSEKVRRREDGIVIQHDPYAPGMMEQYGMPGATDCEGFDPYKDTVGPGIYGGIVKRDVVSCGRDGRGWFRSGVEPRLDGRLGSSRAGLPDPCGPPSPTPAPTPASPRHGGSLAPRSSLCFSEI